MFGGHGGRVPPDLLTHVTGNIPDVIDALMPLSLTPLNTGSIENTSTWRLHKSIHARQHVGLRQTLPEVTSKQKITEN